jgi:hypothetical protein
VERQDTTTGGAYARDRADLHARDVVRVVLALVLLIAAGLKAHQLVTEPVPNKDIFTYRWAMIMQVEFEIVLGLWLLSGLGKRLSWLTAVACFSVFSAVALYKGLLGEASCGCFGSVRVNPWYTFLFDVAAVAALVITGAEAPSVGPTTNRRWRLAALAGVTLVAGIPIGVTAALYEPSTITEAGEIVGGHEAGASRTGEMAGKAVPFDRAYRCRREVVGRTLGGRVL